MSFADILMFLTKLLAGTGVFLVGVHLLTGSIQQLATGKIKELFNKTANNKILNVVIGALTTAIIQSSGVTTVLIVGFVNVGIMNLEQAAAMIMGSNIGTTITAHIAALSTFPITTYIQAFAFIGIMFTMLAKKDSYKKVGSIVAGLGLVFIGLALMSQSMSDYKNQVQVIFEMVENPFILFIIGIVLTALVQSSSATTSIIIAMSVAGLTIGKGNNEILYIILGTNIGSCVTAVLSAISGEPNAKRASLIHLMFNTFGSILFFIVLLIMPDFMNNTFRVWFKETATQIAMFHTFFNVTCTLIFLPISNVFVKISEIIIKDEEVKHETVSLLDERFIKNPMLAITQLDKENIMIINKAMNAFKIGFDSFIQIDNSKANNINELIAEVNKEAHDVTNYLVMVSQYCAEDEHKQMLSAIHENVGDIIRIADIADNFIKYTKDEIEKKLTFSDTFKKELTDMYNQVYTLSIMVDEYIINRTSEKLKVIDALEDKIDKQKAKIMQGHIERLNKGECKPESATTMVNLTSNIERIADHLTFIAHSKDLKS